MDKKKIYIITTCRVISIFSIFQVVMYYAMGQEILLKKEAMRTIWILFLQIILYLSFVKDFIIKRKYENNDKKYKQVKQDRFKITEKA